VELPEGLAVQSASSSFPRRGRKQGVLVADLPVSGWELAPLLVAAPVEWVSGRTLR